MNKYIDAEKLKSIIKVQIKERKEWMKDIDRSDRQDQLWSDLNGEDMSILQIIDSLQQEPIEKDEETEKLIVCDIIEATIARINGGKKDEEKEENIMREKIAYLRDLGLKAK